MRVRHGQCKPGLANAAGANDRDLCVSVHHRSDGQCIAVTTVKRLVMQQKAFLFN